MEDHDTVETREMTFEVTDGAGTTVQVTVIENPDDTLTFNISVVEGIGDLDGFFFDFANPLGDEANVIDSVALVEPLSGDVTRSDFDEADVSNLGGGTNVKGELVNTYGAFDGGVKFGTSGMATTDFQTTTFTLTADRPLSLDDFAGMDFAVRLTSVGADREDSLKLGGTAPELSDDDPFGDGTFPPFTDGFEFDPNANPDGYEDPAMYEDFDPYSDGLTGPDGISPEGPIIDAPIVIDAPIDDGF